MAESPEVETNEMRDTLHELQEEREERGREEKQYAWTRYIALSTAILAVIAAVSALQAGSLVNEAMIAKQDAGIKQALASDQWAYYQAKGIKSLVNGGIAQVLLSSGKGDAAAKLQAKATAQDEDQKKITEKAHEYEAKRDKDNEESEKLIKKHELFAVVVTLTQVAIALSAIAALTRRSYIWFAGMLVGFAGVVIFIWALMPKPGVGAGV